jgi:hypothetical protein
MVGNLRRRQRPQLLPPLRPEWQRLLDGLVQWLTVGGKKANGGLSEGVAKRDA